MHGLIIILLWLLIISCLLYMLVIIIITVGWSRLKHFDEQGVTNVPFISIVIAVRNESTAIENLLKSLIQQHYPPNHFEVIIVDDHSDDNTVELINQFSNHNNTFCIKLFHANKRGKKAAIKQGINNAKHNLIVTTDGDCRMGNKWLSCLADYYEMKSPKLLAGPVVYSNNKGTLQQFFMLDFMSLVAAGAGSLGLGLPLMGNAANMVFTKQTYFEIESLQDGKAHASGDDVFLMQAISKKYGSKEIHFIKNKLATVETAPPSNLKSFFSQRTRWASKAVAYRSWWAILVSIIVFAFNFFLVIGLLYTLIYPKYAVIYVLFILLKLIIDSPLLHLFSGFVKRKISILKMLLLGFIYPVYIVVTAVFAFLYPYNWKGRNDIK